MCPERQPQHRQCYLD
ncbi:unnamed protein product [Gulo gulo]|uniref:Uncharacterized protein n=1 Tax=Gulo gulo TaxID=48420 RepID=A0A9X9LPA2_GULGU|nr:unnamed protein product [Gulo gulo]